MKSTSSSRLGQVDALRGLAALAVAWFHFTQGNASFLPEGTLKSSGTWGWLGVEVFFVISGFVLPLALRVAGYQVAAFPRFLGRRLVRLEPPYLASIVIVLALGWLSSRTPGFAGQPWSFDGVQVAAHLGYLSGMLGLGWLNPVYWTLAIELQFYLLVGLTYGLIMHPRALVRWLTLVAWLLLSVAIPSGSFVPHYLGLFGLGLVTLWLREGFLDGREYLAVSLVIALVVGWQHGLPVAIAGLLAAWAIAWVRLDRVPGMCWLGAVSYSLYLLHIPIGGRVVNLGARYADQVWSHLLVLGLAVALSLGAAWLLSRYVERPAMAWAARIRYSPSPPQGLASGGVRA